MKTLKHEAAFPVVGVFEQTGLTKLEYMSIEFAKACISNPNLKQGISDKEICKKAIEISKELIKQLNEQ